MPDTFLVQLNVTRDCNLRCTHCYIHSDTKKASGKITPERFLAVIDQVVMYLSAQPHYRLADIHVIGGEPTQLGHAFYRQVLPEARSKLDGHSFAYNLRLVTNLVGADVLPIARMFDHISTSYETATRFVKAAHERMWAENIQILQSEGKTLQASVTMTRPVCEEGAAKLLEKLTGLGLQQIHFGFFVPSGDALVHARDVQPSHEQQSNFLIEVADWYFQRRDSTPGLLISPIESLLAAIEQGDAVDDIVCPIISGSVDVNWDGNAASCLQTGGNPGATMAGNVFKLPLVNLMESLPIRREVVEANRPKAVCNNCDEYYLCRGGCGVMHTHWNGQGECPGFLGFIRHLRKYHENGCQSLQGRSGQVDAALRYMVTRA